MSGHQFLCEILKNMYASFEPDERRALLQIHIQNNTPLTDDECKTIYSEFAEFAHQVKNSRPMLYQELNALLYEYYDALDSSPFFVDVSAAHDNKIKNKQQEQDKKKNTTKNTSLESLFNRLLCKGTGALPPALAGIAMTFVLGAGYRQQSQFYIGKEEIRAILTGAMEVFGENNVAFIPEKFFEVKDGNADPDLLRLLLLSLYGALRIKYPHQTTNVKQVLKNQIAAANAVKKLISSNAESPLFAAILSSNKVKSICDSMEAAMKADAQWIRFPIGKEIKIESFYRIPQLETIGRGTREILQCDYNAPIRSVVLGKTGSGKSLFTKAIIRTCLEPVPSRTDEVSQYAQALGLEEYSYLPLVLDCKALSTTEIDKLDLIQKAVEQLSHLTRMSPFAYRMEHWDDFSGQVEEYYRQKCKTGGALLIIEDLSCLDSDRSSKLLQKLNGMTGGEYAHLHILVVTQRLVPSQMIYFNNNYYNCVEIAPLSGDLGDEIRKMVSLGIASATEDEYLTLLSNNRCVRSFVDTPDHLIKLLCYPYEKIFDLDGLLWQTIDEHIGRHSTSAVAESDCREFLTALAVGVAESQNKSRFTTQSFPTAYHNIPKNILQRGTVDPYLSKISAPETVWRYIMDNMILVYPNQGIVSYAFVNPMFYCSLVADYYLQQIGNNPNWLDRFNCLSCEDFSTIIVMVLNRLSKHYSDDTARDTVSNYDILCLLQSVVGYIASKADPVGLHHCLLALQDLLTNERLRGALKKEFWDMLKNAYTNHYHRFAALSDDSEKLERLMKPDAVKAAVKDAYAGATGR